MTTAIDHNLKFDVVHDYAADYGWQSIIESMLDFRITKKKQQCPVCESNNWRFDDNQSKGNWVCSCDAGDGFNLLQKANGWTPVESLKAVSNFLNLTPDTVLPPPKQKQTKANQEEALQTLADTANFAKKVMANTERKTHGYMARKGFKNALVDVTTKQVQRTKADGNKEIIPPGMMVVPYCRFVDNRESLATVQRFYARKTKDMNDKPLLFGKGTSTETYAQITHDKADTATIYIGEGYATTYTAHHLMNALCYVAGSGSNLPYVVRQVKERFPESRIVALIDNGKTGHKVGHELANDGVSFVMPPKSKGGDDLNDYFVERGEQATKDLIQEQLTNPLPISEFNEQTPTNKADQKKNVTLINTIKQVSADTALFADMVRVASGLSVSGDEYQISQAIKARFEGRLAILSGESHFFCGIKWHYIDDSMLKRAVGHILSEGCDDATTGNRIKSVSQILQDNLERLGEKNPSSSKIIFADKILDTNNWQFEPHNADHLNTRTLSVNYPQTNECPQFLNFLNGIFSDEPERINLLQEIMGYALLPDNLNIQKALMFVGASRAGKGVIFELMKAIMRDGAMGSVKLNEIDNHKQQSGMLASSICVDSDAVSPPANSCRTIMGLLKVITANEPLSIQQLYKQRPLETRLDCKVLIIANQSLTLIDDSGAMADRWMPLVFTKSMLGKEDVTLKDRLLTELEGIAGWALDGLKRLIQTRQFTMPKSSLDFLENLRADSGSLSAFITDELEFSADFRVSEKDLWNAYHLWSIQTGVEQHKRRHFLTNLETALRPHNVQRKQSLRITPGGKPQRGFDGIRLRVTGASNF